MDFKGDEALNSESIGDVFSAALGYSVVHPSDWSGLYINNPFSPAQGVVALIVDGISNINLEAAKPISYPIDGSDSEDSIDSLISQVRQHNGLTANLDFSHGATVSQSCFAIP